MSFTLRIYLRVHSNQLMVGIKTKGKVFFKITQETSYRARLQYHVVYNVPRARTKKFENSLRRRAPILMNFLLQIVLLPSNYIELSLQRVILLCPNAEKSLYSTPSNATYSIYIVFFLLTNSGALRIRTLKHLYIVLDI